MIESNDSIEFFEKLLIRAALEIEKNNAKDSKQFYFSTSGRKTKASNAVYIVSVKNATVYGLHDNLLYKKF